MSVIDCDQCNGTGECKPGVRCPCREEDDAAELKRKEMGVVAPSTVLEMFIVYDHPRDHPGKFVLRKWWIGVKRGEPLPDAEWFVLADSLEAIRSHVPAHCVRLERDPDDEPQIVESWI